MMNCVSKLSNRGPCIYLKPHKVSVLVHFLTLYRNRSFQIVTTPDRNTTLWFSCFSIVFVAQVVLISDFPDFSVLKRLVKSETNLRILRLLEHGLQKKMRLLSSHLAESQSILGGEEFHDRGTPTLLVKVWCLGISFLDRHLAQILTQEACESFSFFRLRGEKRILSVVTVSHEENVSNVVTVSVK